jgi:hypothetical protein
MAKKPEKKSAAKKSKKPAAFKPSSYEKVVQKQLDKKPKSKTLARDIANAVVSELLKNLNKMTPPFAGTTSEFLMDEQSVILNGTGQGDGPKSAASNPDPDPAP